MLRFTVLAACEHLHISQKLYYEYSVPRPVYMCSIRGRDKKKLKKKQHSAESKHGTLIESLFIWRWCKTERELAGLEGKVGCLKYM